MKNAGKKFTLPSMMPDGEFVDHGGQVEEMFGSRFYPVVYFAPSDGRIVVSLPKGMTDDDRREVIDVCIAGLVAVRP